MKTETRSVRTCPICGNSYTGETLICPDCGTRQALESIGVSEEEQEKILETIHRAMV